MKMPGFMASTLGLVVLLDSGCFSPGGSEDGETDTGEETATGEDEVAESSTTTTTTTDDESSSDTTEDDSSCPIGAEGCPCTRGMSCDDALVCEDGICVPQTDTTETTTETTETTETGSTVCDMDVSFEMLAIDATDVDGWMPTMSMLGEGLIMAWDMQTQNAYISWDIDVPCDDTWHVWVRGIDQGQADSYFATVDGQPNPAPIFELDCTQGPAQAAYVWKQLNWRDQADPTCTYVQDPWTHDWQTGIHDLTLSYRETTGVSRIWITNTDQPPL